jgi:hypothetical protein
MGGGTGKALRWGLGVVLMAALGACRPSRESLTAGNIGCPPNEVTTSPAGSSTGWNQSAETWFAECRGRRFVCTEVLTSSFDIDWLFRDSTESIDSDVSCREEIPSSEALARAAATSEEAAHSAPPRGGAGFELGSSRAAARGRCEAAGHRWEEGGGEQATCTGTAAEVGFAAPVALTFCRHGLCGIAVSLAPEEHWMQRFASLRRTLTTKYGSPSSKQMSVPSSCRTDEAFDGCAREGTLSLHLSWRWPTGQRLRLSLGKPQPQGSESRVQITYVQPAQVSALNDTAF